MNYTYNEGELSIQEKYGEIEIANRVKRVVKNEIVPGAIAFIENQPMLILSTLDKEDRVWTSILIGKHGFVKVNNQREIIIDIAAIKSDMNDLFYENLPSKVGVIFIELGSRRRFRVNGTVNLRHNNIYLQVEEAYPNCPKYIQRRILTIPEEVTNLQPVISEGVHLTMSQQLWILNADTFFVGSQSFQKKLDASHRGGNYGFVEVLENGTLKIPDYTGNSMYNTLGNIQENPNVGLLFIDFKHGNILQMTGKATLLFDQNSEADKHKTTHTGRYWIFKCEKWIQTNQHHNVTWTYEDASPFNPNMLF